MKKRSKTDWARVKREAAQDAPIPYSPEDGPYDPNDAAAVDRYWKSAKVTRHRGPQKSPTKVAVTVRYGRDVIDYFKRKGRGWQTRMDEALREYIAHH
jgi:uncharacterized protein (DUF4415 family)